MLQGVRVPSPYMSGISGHLVRMAPKASTASSCLPLSIHLGICRTGSLAGQLPSVLPRGSAVLVIKQCHDRP